MNLNRQEKTETESKKYIKDPNFRNNFLISKSYEYFIKTILPCINQKIDNKENFDISSSLILCKQDFIDYFSDIINKEIENIQNSDNDWLFDNENIKFTKLWEGIKEKIEERFLILIVHQIRQRINRRNYCECQCKCKKKCICICHKKGDIWELLQYHDYLNYKNIHNKEIESKINKISKCESQKKSLDEQVVNKKPIDEIIENAIYLLNQSSLKDLVHNKKNDKKEETMEKSGKPNEKIEKTIKIEEKKEINEEDIIYTNKKYRYLLNNQNNFQKNDDLNKFDYKNDCVKIDKKTVYNLRNRSNIFFNNED